MKKTFNINIAGFPFVIDEDAYSLLNEYLQTIQHAFARLEDSTEIQNDIESRIAELLFEANADADSQIVTIEMVKSVIERIGNPEEIIDEEINLETSSNGFTTVSAEETVATPPPYNQEAPKLKKRLYRDPKQGMIGGVCAGLGWYFNIDPTWIRLAMVLFVIFSYSLFLVAYIVLWIVLPEPKTPLQRMQMMGEQPTVENIGRTVTGDFSASQPDSRPAWAQQLEEPNAFKTICSIIGRIFVVIGLIIGSVIFISMMLGIIGCVFALIMFSTAALGGAPADFIQDFGPDVFWGVLIGLGGCLFLGVPLFVLLRRGFASNRAPLSKTTNWVLSALCLIGFLTASVSTGILIKNHKDDKEDYIIRNERFDRFQRLQRLERMLNNQDFEELFELDDEELDDMEIISIGKSGWILSNGKDTIEISKNDSRYPKINKKSIKINRNGISVDSENKESEKQNSDIKYNGEKENRSDTVIRVP